MSAANARSLVKEVTSYQREAEDAKRAADKMRAEGVDPYKIVRSALSGDDTDSGRRSSRTRSFRRRS